MLESRKDLSTEMKVAPNRRDHPGIFPYFRRGKFDPLFALKTMCTKAVAKSSQCVNRCLRHVCLRLIKRNPSLGKDVSTKKAAVDTWVRPVKLILRRTHSSPPKMISAKKLTIEDGSEVERSILEDHDEGFISDASFSLSNSHHGDTTHKPLVGKKEDFLLSDKSKEEQGSSIVGKSSCEEVLDDMLFEVIEIIDRKEHMEAVEGLVQEMFRKAQATLMEEVSNLHEMMNKRFEAHDKKTDDVNDKIMQIQTSNSVFREDFSELGQAVASVTTKCDQVIGESEMNKVSINKNKEEIESLKLKAVEYQKSFENMESMKIDFASNKRKHTEDHNSIVQEIDQVRKKQRVHEAHFADIEREVSLLKIQFGEAKKDDAGSQSLKKEIEQLKSQIVQVEARLTVKMEQPAPVSPMLGTNKSPQFFSPPTPSSCKGSGKSMQEDQNEAMVIFLNRASVKEIATLPAIGHKTAQLIYNHREMRGKFTCLMQIKNVPGISQNVFSKFLLQNQLTLY